jgi:hypothetical protein
MPRLRYVLVCPFYAVYMTILLVQRCFRDERRCLAKYGYNLLA